MGRVLGAVLFMAVLAGPSQAAAFEPLSQFGSTGAAAGQLNSPVGLAIVDNGDIYVAELANRRVSQFSADGTFIRAFGADVALPDGGTAPEVCTTATGCQAGALTGAAGGFFDAAGIALGPDGHVFVADFGGQRISEFTATGDFVKAFGFDVAEPDGGTALEVCTTGTGCRSGDGGGAAGQFSSPDDVAVDSSGNVYVSEANNARLSQYTSAGAFVRSWGFDVITGGGTGFEICNSNTGCKAGVPGSEAGQLSGVRQLEVGPDGNVYVADTGSERVSRYTGSGSFVSSIGFDVVPGNVNTGFEVCTLATACKTGVGGSGAGQFTTAFGVEVAPTGEVFVTDVSLDRVSQFNANLDFVRAFGFDVMPPDGGTGFEVCTAATGCLAGDAGSGFGQFDDSQDVQVDCRGAIWTTEAGPVDRVTRFGEPGTPLPPCPASTGGGGDPGPTDPGPTDPTPTPDPNPKPPNDITIGKAKLNTKKGNAKLPVDVPGAGELELVCKGVKPVTKDVTKAGTVQLPVKPKGKTADKLEDKGSAKVSCELTFTPTGGDANSESKSVKLKLK